MPTRAVAALMLAIVVVQACDAATRPLSGSLEVTLLPTNVQQSNFDGRPPEVRFYNGNPFTVRFSGEEAIVQAEVTPGTWEKVAGGTNVMVLPHSLSDIEPNGQRTFD